MKIRLKPISPKRISDQVFDQLRELIFRGDFQPGEKIMTERELAEALNVSRNSVREAINKLVTLRFLEQRQGQGTFVRSMDEAVKIPLATVMETQDASLIDLLEMRMGIECNAASLAAQRANATDLEAIEKAIGEMDTDTDAGGLGTEGDLVLSHGHRHGNQKSPAGLHHEKCFGFPACGHPGKPAAPLPGAG
jgi:GntR family transcriptional repressor for pyruvate dehydrogenase complex